MEESQGQLSEWYQFWHTWAPTVHFWQAHVYHNVWNIVSWWEIHGIMDGRQTGRQDWAGESTSTLACRLAWIGATPEQNIIKFTDTERLERGMTKVKLWQQRGRAVYCCVARVRIWSSQVKLDTNIHSNQGSDFWRGKVPSPSINLSPSKMISIDAQPS